MTIEGNTKGVYDKLRELGLKVFVSNPRNYEGIKKTLKDLAKIYKRETKADSIVARWNSTVEAIKRSIAKREKHSVMFLVAAEP